MSVDPLIAPDGPIRARPLDVVTVQSAVCADGLERIAFRTTCLAVISSWFMSVVRDETPLLLTTSTPLPVVALSRIQFVPSYVNRTMDPACHNPASDDAVAPVLVFIAIAPVLFTLRVGDAAVFLFVN